LASPDLDGFATMIYRNYWEIIGNYVSNLVLDVLNSNSDPGEMNKTYICLTS